MTCIVTCDRASWPVTVHHCMWPCIVTCDLHRGLWPCIVACDCIVTCDRASWHVTAHRDMWPRIVTCDRASWHVTVHRDMWPCIVRNFFVIKPTRCTNFTNLFCHETTCFGQFVCPSSGVYSLYTQHWYMSYRFVEQLSSRTRPGLALLESCSSSSSWLYYKETNYRMFWSKVLLQKLNKTSGFTLHIFVRKAAQFQMITFYRNWERQPER